jgi:flavodoxin
MKKTPSIAIIYNSFKNKNSKKIAKKIFYKIKKCKIITAESNEKLDNFDFIFFIVPNVGDEELPEPIESYLLSLKTKNKKYFLCELGNYFGFEYKGCKNIVFNFLDSLGWEKQSEISLDSVPSIDKKNLKKWIKKCKSIVG